MTTVKRPIELLFIEDTVEDAELAVINLAREGFQINWNRVDNEKDLRELLARWQPDIILSDYSMPAFNGRAALLVCQELVPEIPFIFLSGTIGEELAIESIHDGATDYVLKENMRRLSTSIRRAVNDSEKRRRAQEMEKERSRLIAILEATSDFVVIMHPDESIAWMNQGARKLLDLDRETTELTIRDLYPAQHWLSVKESLAEDEGGSSLWTGDTVLLAADGSQIPASQVVISHRENAGGVEFYSFIARDIRDRRAYEKQIQYLANYDMLTELPNRTLLQDRATQAINNCQWTKRSLALLIVDIDRFKLINDGYGRACGDVLLKEFGKRLGTAVRTRDTVARISADCFAVLASDLSSPDDVIGVVGKVQETLREPFMANGRHLTLTIGIGVSIFPRDGRDFATLLQNADAAMHRQKEQGGDGFQFYAYEMTRSASDRVRLENELREALVSNGLELYYQPQMNLASGEMIGFEALMRWHHPARGMISPLMFIPMAENSELICPMGEWALVTACRQLRQWDALGAARMRMAVNVSARQFRSKGFAATVARVLEAEQLEPHRLELELTESVLVHDHQEAVKVLNALNELGVQIALDDFGTGYSNLSYLSRLPLHCLKIDQSFVQRALQDSNDAEIVQAIISLAAALGLRVIAEGIETRQQMELLREYKCGEGQGFYFARPLPAAQIPALLGSPGPT